MKTLVLSDLHASPALFHNALKHAGAADRIVVAGDLVDIGPDPGETIRAVVDSGAEVLFGNHELAVMHHIEISPQDEVSFSYKAFLWDKAFVEYDRWKLAANVDGILVSHAGFSDFYQRIFDVAGSVAAFVEFINEDFVADQREVRMRVKHFNNSYAYEANGPLWFRPENQGQLLEGPRQIIGHTPDLYYTAEELIGFREKGIVFVDPYARKMSSMPGYYCYALVEDGEVRRFRGVL